MPLRSVCATRFLTSMIEGGSRPALVKADDGGMYVVKLRGAAQGVAPLLSEIIVGELARRLGLAVPEIVLVTLPAAFGKGGPDEELRELLQWSAGTNVGLRFVEGATMFDPASVTTFYTALAEKIVWLDALTLNVDRTAANPNLLQRGEEIILIDHGASLYFHFHWSSYEGKSGLPFEAIGNHVLLPWIGDLKLISRHARTVLTPDVLEDIVAGVPDDLFNAEGAPPLGMQRELYVRFLLERLAGAEKFEEEVKRQCERRINTL